MKDLKDYLDNYKSPNKNLLKENAIKFLNEIKKLSDISSNNIILGNNKRYKHKDNVMLELNFNGDTELTNNIYYNLENINKKLKLDVNVDIAKYSDFILIYFYK